MKKYTKYKTSGVEWIGEIPEHWQVWKIKHTTYVKGRIGWQALTTAEYKNEGPFLVTGTDFDKGRINWNSCHHVSLERYNMDRFIQLFEGDVLITKDGSIGKVAVVKNLIGKATLNSGVFVTRPLANKKYFDEYFYWLLISNVFVKFIDYTTTGTTISHLYQNVFIEFLFPIPPLPEQSSIARFLDHKTALIDRITSNRRKQIDLLKEERKAVINKAVTKGINKNAKMKPSGVEWLGEIPEHWESQTMKRNSTIIDGDRGNEYPNENDFVNNGIPFLSTSNIKSNRLVFSNLRFISEQKLKKLGKGKLQKNDLVITVRGTIGATAIFRAIEFPTAFINAQMMIIRPSIKLNIDYLNYTTLSEYWKVQLDYNSYGTAQQQLTNAILQNIILALPPFSEQILIARFLDQKTSKIDTLITKYERQISLLEEYRTALISKAVTGQIDVREWQPKAELEFMPC